MTTPGSPWDGFGLRLGYAGERPVLAVRGEVDLVTAPELGAILDALIERGHREVVLDLSDLDFMGAVGLSVIAHAAGRLDEAASHGGVVLRCPPAPLTRMLEITGMADAVRVEALEAGQARLGVEQTVAVPGNPVSGAAGLVGQLRRVTAIPAADDVVDGALRLVVTLALATVGGAHGASVSLRRHGQLVTVAASDRTVSEMDAEQYAAEEGPCVDASTVGRWFHAESLDTESRWPTFTAKARQLGINAILSTPLMAATAPVGALNIYSRTIPPFAAAEQERAAIFATQASLILEDAGVDVTDAALAGRFSDALAARAAIAHAQGVIMAREGVSAEEAYAVLRHRSLAAQRSLRDVAGDVVSSTGPPPEGGRPGSTSDG